MIFIVAPEPSDWLQPLLGALPTLVAPQPIAIFAPWAWPGAPPAGTPATLARGWARRSLGALAADALVLGRNPAWWLADAGLRAFSGSTVDRAMRARVARRWAADRLAAWALPDDATTVIAPSLAARHTLAAARARGLRTLLVEDLPSLRELHADLDAAALRWPESRFLRRYRAPAEWVSAQRAERLLAETLLVRNRFAARCRRTEGFVDVRPLPAEVPIAVAATPHSPPRTVLLAGTAAARHGTNDLLALLAARRDLTLLVQPGEGSEPLDLLSRAQVRASTPPERQRLEGVDLVVAPAWCEAHLPQLAVAAARGIPILATDRVTWAEGAPERPEDALRPLRGT